MIASKMYHDFLDHTLVVDVGPLSIGMTYEMVLMPKCRRMVITFLFKDSI